MLKPSLIRLIFSFHSLLVSLIPATVLASLPQNNTPTQSSEPTSYLTTPLKNEQEAMQAFCKEFSNKLRTVTYKGCLALDLEISQQRSVENRLLTYREIIPNDNVPPKGRVLFIGGIHGDEYSAISLSYIWLQTILNNPGHNQYKWLFLPLTNPDGLLQKKAQRQNVNGVDLNRNFPTPDWAELAHKTWKTHYHKNKRRYPGPSANSEPETQWITMLIDRYQPDVIISLHSPYGVLDYDGPEHAEPDQIGSLKLKQLGTYPGSLGRYAGEYQNLPVLTIELKHSGKMPKTSETLEMWKDVEAWISEKIETTEKDF